MIVEYPNTLITEFCTKVVKLFKKNNSIEPDETEDDQTDIFFNQNPQLQEEMFSILSPYVVDYFSRIGFTVLASWFNLTDLCVMNKTTGREIHFDNSLFLKNGKELLNPAAFLIFLNDNFNGGELIFPYQKTTIFPEEGKLTVFPSHFTYPHFVETADNNRYVMKAELTIKPEYREMF